MKKVFLVIATFVVQTSFAQNPSRVGTLEITNDGVYNSSINSGNVARMDMGFDGAKGFVKFGAHTGNGQRDNILYMRGSDGNVGIGTNEPTDLLHLNSVSPVLRMTYQEGGFAAIRGLNSTWIFGFNGNPGFEDISFGTQDGSGSRTLTFAAGGSTRMKILNNGNVGIGTLSPQQKLVVSNNGAEGFEVYLDQLNSVVGLQSFNRALYSYSKMQLDASQFSFMYGNVGIGLVNPTNKLDVNGTIHSKEVKVDLSGWPDYVFKKEYNLPTLEEVEKHISEKGHLKNIPSEEEVLKNGINLGEMNAKLLQKIEEMTLYMIEQNKKINDLQRENKKLGDLEKKFEKFEKTLKHKTK
ncbi:hypothetical protein [Flavobacterium sp.]|uniref:hypothetical protein n=1 Tax=Flavobacterium sp. TaxID=239 RepID=UPI0025BF942A|nr:hypothetical protein [Flavobacterium sp.]